MDNFEEGQSKYGRIYKVAGPLVVGENMSGSKMYELVKIGWDKLVGEIIKLEGDTASIQCYEDTCKYTFHHVLTFFYSNSWSYLWRPNLENWKPTLS